jgi:hypothetical protein
MPTKRLKHMFIALGFYPYIVAIRDRKEALSKLKDDFNEFKFKSKNAEDARFNDYLRWKYAQGCKVEEYFNYMLWKHSWENESPWLLESKRREILALFNSDQLRNLLNSKIETAKLFQRGGTLDAQLLCMTTVRANLKTGVALMYS